MAAPPLIGNCSDLPFGTPGSSCLPPGRSWRLIPAYKKRGDKGLDAWASHSALLDFRVTSVWRVGEGEAVCVGVWVWPVCGDGKADGTETAFTTVCVLTVIHDTRPVQWTVRISVLYHFWPAENQCAHLLHFVSFSNETTWNACPEWQSPRWWMVTWLL